MKSIGRCMGLVLLAGCMQRETRNEEPEPFSAQAQAGAALYGKHCSHCHGDSGEGTDKGPRVVGLTEGALPIEPRAGAKRTVQFRTVADVAKFAVKAMPGDDPGALPVADYWRILAFDLKANGIDLGSKTLDMTLAQTLVIPRAAPSATNGPLSPQRP